MVGLNRHHGPTGASKFGLTDWATCDPLMRQQLLRWQALLFEPCGVSVKRALLRVELEDPPKVFFDVTSDTCLADVDHAGIGGFCHGLFWFYEVPEDVRLYLTFFQYLRGASQTGQHGANMRIPLRTDALTSALALPASTANAEVMQDFDHHLLATTEWRRCSSGWR